ncbi:ubiquinol-cytochrome c reductase iron-sulfur subunit [Geoalkalibacter halelectricus]|uniref:Rieske (2Fe-2S) protein n=1 Tax=Geoalkalibacter halelectricus TaxID=2847045 RepID=A0ABY5ZJW8_9BACT|nr:Rieske (2Fe-2S) protein [Geoalkalibacter halelectricus]MDO3380149.1 Rieske (2Fe-2S) protein [Geoalkalibacter halelectricus]UWZ78277.1 Rieske (2Fe-2S) protein [Geoalkalibacter halelectricus]
MDIKADDINRRRVLLGTLLGGLGAVLAAAGVYPVWRFLAPPATDEALDQVTLFRDQVPLGGAHFFNFRGRPAVIIQMRPGDFTAFSAVCTHLGCVVQWQAAEQRFLCPCHAGLFSADGAVIGGPPPRPLERLAVSLRDDRILVG